MSGVKGTKKEYVTVGAMTAPVRVVKQTIKHAARHGGQFGYISILDCGHPALTFKQMNQGQRDFVAKPVGTRIACVTCGWEEQGKGLDITGNNRGADKSTAAMKRLKQLEMELEETKRQLQAEAVPVARGTTAAMSRNPHYNPESLPTPMDEDDKEQWVTVKTPYTPPAYPPPATEPTDPAVVAPAPYGYKRNGKPRKIPITPERLEQMLTAMAKARAAQDELKRQDPMWAKHRTEKAKATRAMRKALREGKMGTDAVALIQKLQARITQLEDVVTRPNGSNASTPSANPGTVEIYR